MRAETRRGAALDTYAKEAGLSRAHFFRLFEILDRGAAEGLSDVVRMETGGRRGAESVGERLRHQQSARLCRAGHFTRFFRNHAGVSTREFRRVPAGELMLRRTFGGEMRRDGKFEIGRYGRSGAQRKYLPEHQVHGRTLDGGSRSHSFADREPGPPWVGRSIPRVEDAALLTGAAASSTISGFVPARSMRRSCAPRMPMPTSSPSNHRRRNAHPGSWRFWPATTSRR